MRRFFPSTIRQAGGAILPPTLAGLEAWYDVTDFSTVTIDGSDKITQLLDKSGNSRTMTPSTNGPLYEPTGFKSTYPSMKFDLTNSEDLKASFTLIGFPLCAFGIADYSLIVSGRTGVFSYVLSGNAAVWWAHQASPLTNNNYRNTTQNIVSTGSNAADPAVAFYMEKTSTTKRVIDKVADNSLADAQLYGNFNTLYLGRLRDASSLQFNTVRFSELFLLSQIPIDSDKQLMFDYFAAKYGVAIPTI